MSASAQRAECYGKMFPDFTRLKKILKMDPVELCKRQCGK